MTLVSDDFCKVDLLAHMWRYPTVSIHGIEGAFSDSGTKTVIPAKVTAKFSIRQVPDMDPAMVKKQVHREGHPSLALRLTISIFCTFTLLNCCGIIGLLVGCLGDRLSSVGICQEEESQQAQSHDGDWGQALAGQHWAPTVWGREGSSQQRCLNATLSYIKAP